MRSTAMFLFVCLGVCGVGLFAAESLLPFTQALNDELQPRLDTQFCALHDSDTGTIAGQILDERDRATFAGRAVVFLCDAKTSYPIHRETKKPIAADMRAALLDKLWYAVTDENGTFEFKDVPVGDYRLVAQSWSGTEGMPKSIQKTSTFLILHGVAENVVVQKGERTLAYPRSLGNRTLRITNDPEEPHAILLISLEPTIGDAILGPAGWGSEFLSHAIGVTMISGLPDVGDVHVGLLNYDNNPGFGNATFKARQREGKLRIVASWSNGHHEPPPELKELTDQLEKMKLTFNDLLSEKDKTKYNHEAGAKLVDSLRADPRREVDVPGLGKRRLADVLAALGYVQLRARFRK
jgi:hypothetical protein